jgi:hypothetical protein
MQIGACTARRGIRGWHLTISTAHGSVRGGLTDWYGTLKHLKPDLAPLADRLELDTAVDQSLSQISPAGPEGVGADSDRSRRFVGFKESDSLKISSIRQDISLY